MARRKISVVTNDLAVFKKALMREAEVALPTYFKESMAQLAYKVYYGIVLSTPVLTGRARVNWMVTFTAPSTRTIDEEQVIDEPGHWFSVTGQSFSSTERDLITGVMDKLREGPLARRVFFTNNLAYINILEDGIGSAKAPFGMVEITLDWVQQANQKNAIHRVAINKT